MLLIFKSKAAILFWVFLFFSITFTNAQTTETFQTSGSFTWICPANVTSVTVQCWGGGGGGGSSNNSSTYGGHGGGGGAFSQSTLSVSPGQIYYLSVGSSGAGAPANSFTLALNGGDSWFNSINSIPISTVGVLAKGGLRGGNNTNFLTTNSGPIVSGFGIVKYPGGSGYPGSLSGGGGGGSSAGNTAVGVNSVSTIGGTAPSNGGDGGGAALFPGWNGINGYLPGGGGGGSDDVAGSKGGDGGVGQIILSYTFDNCFGSPNSGTASATPNSGCGTTILFASGLSTGPGITYQWQNSSDNVSWTDIAGATSTSYTATTSSTVYFRLKSICAFGGTSYSNSTIYTFSGNASQPAPSASAVTIECGQTTTLLATGGGTSNYSWFSTPTSSSPIGTGNTYTTPNLNTNTSYYVASSILPQYQQTYLIPVSDLVNLTFDCGNGSIYGTGAIGFNWTDVLPQSVNVTSVTAELSLGTECTAGLKTTTLNDVAQSSFTTTANCSCNGNSLQTLNLATANYVKNGLNLFRVTNASSFGFNSSNAQFSGYFARITVSYNVVTPCYSTLTEVPVTIIPSSTAGIVTSNQTICVGSIPSSLSFSGITGALQWQSSLDSLSWVNISGATSTSLTSAQIGALSTTTFYRVIVTNSGCATAVSNVVKVLVNPLPIVFAGNDQFSCAGSLVTLSGSGAQTYTWNNGVLNNVPFALNSTTTYTVIGTDNNNCQNSDQVIVTVTPQSIGGTATSNQNICVSGTPSTLSLTGFLGIIQWQSSLDNSLWSNITGANAVTFSPGVLNQTTYYRALVTNGICTSAASNVVTVTIFPSSVAGSAAPSQIICAGTAASPIVLTGNTGTVQWNIGSTSTGPFSPISGANSTTLSSAQIGILGSSRYYQATVTSGVCASVNSNVVMINVTPQSVGGTATSSHVACQGIPANNLTLTGYLGTIQWQSSTDNITFSNVTGTAATFSPGALNQTTYFRAAVTNGFCPTAYSTVVTITVSPTSNAGVLSSNQTICSGTSPASLVLNGSIGSIVWQQSPTGLTGTWITINGVTSTTLSSAQMGVLTSPKYYRVIVTSGVCAAAISGTVSVLVNPIPTVTAPTSQTLCNGSATSAIVFSGTGTAYNWTNSQTSIGLGGSGVGNIGSFAVVNVSGVSTTANMVVTPEYTANGVSCYGTPQNFTFTVFPTSLSGTASSSQTICSGSSPTSLTLSNYLGTIQWQFSNDNLNWNIINGATTATLTSAQMGALSTIRYYRAIVTSGVCASATSNVVTISINALPIVNAGVDQTICQGTPIVLAGSGASTYTWTNGVINNNAFSPISSNTYTVTGTNSNGCINSDAVIVTVNPLSAVGTISASQTICTGTTPATLTMTGTSTGTLQWQYSNDNVNWVNTGTAATTLTAAQMGPLTAIRYYRLVVTSGICAPVISNKVTVTIVPNPIGGTAQSNQTICAGSVPAPLTVSGFIGSLQWQISANGSTLWSNISGATTSTLSSAQIGVLNATRYYRVLVVNSPCAATVYSNVITITVNSPSVAGSINPSIQDICVGTSASQLSVISSTGTNYQWQFSSSPTGPWSAPIVGASSSVLTSTQIGTLSGTTFYQATVTNGVCPSAVTPVAQINVSTTSSVGIVSSDQTLCSGTIPNGLQLSSYNGTIQWETATSPTGTWSSIGSNSPILTSAQIGVLTSTKYYRAFVFNGPCSAAYSNYVTITVNPIPTVTSPTNQTVCANSNTTSLNFTGTGSSYNWINSQPSIGLAASGTGNITSFVAQNSGTTNLTATITVTPQYTANSTSCFGTTQSFTFTVNPTSNSGIASSDQTICTGTVPSPLNLAGNVGTIQWQSATSLLGTWTNVLGATSNTYAPASLTTIRFYRAITTSGTCPKDTSNVVTITVSPNTVAGTITTTQTAVCSGFTPNNFTLTGNVGTVQWQIATTLTPTANWTNIVGATALTLAGAQIGPITSTTYIRAVVTSGACSSLTTNTITLTVTAPSVAGIVSTNQTICLGSSAAALNVSTSTGTFQWQSSTNGINFTNIASATASAYSPGAVATTTYYQVLATNGVCPADTSNFVQITVFTNPVAGTASSNQSICAGTSPAPLSLNGYNGSVLWQWAPSTTGTWTTIPGANSAVLPSATMGNLSTVRYYRAMVTNSPCSGTVYSNIITISILAAPTINAGTDQSVCQGTSVVLSATGGTGYVWNNGVVNNVSFIATTTTTYTVTGTGTNGCTNSDQVVVNILPTPAVNISLTTQGVICAGQPFVLTSTVTNGVTYQWKRNSVNIVGATSPWYTGTLPGTYSLTVTNGTCITNSPSLTISVVALPTVNAGLDQSICIGESITLNGSGATNYSWSNGVTNGVAFAPNTTQTYTVSTTNGQGCVGTDQVIINVHYPTTSQIYVSSLGSYFLNGTEYTQSGTYLDTTLNQWGCDSIITLNLTVYNVGLLEANNDYFTIYPNPSPDGRYFIEWNENVTITRLSVKDASGRVYREIFTKSNEIDLSDLPAGLYFLEIESADLLAVVRVVKL
jgi:hypothetical protein